MNEPTPDEARAALGTVEQSHHRVVDEIDIPFWYWAFVAGGRVALGTLAELDVAWLTAGSTLLFGAAHASLAPRVVDGRHRCDRARVRADVRGPHVAGYVFGGLVGLVAVTVAAAPALDADGARHPSFAASVLAAVVVLLGGPLLMSAVRRRAARRPTA